MAPPAKVGKAPDQITTGDLNSHFRCYRHIAPNSGNANSGAGMEIGTGGMRNPI